MQVKCAFSTGESCLRFSDPSLPGSVQGGTCLQMETSVMRVISPSSPVNLHLLEFLLWSAVFENSHIKIIFGIVCGGMLWSPTV